METKRKPRGYWTLERCMEDAAQYSGRKEWQIASRTAYTLAQKRGWVDACCEHMEPRRNPPGYWTLDRCMEDAARFSTRTEWARASQTAYKRAGKSGWIEMCCEGMSKPPAHNKKWCAETCKADAENYLTRSEWQRESGSAYVTAKREGWLEYCCAHMERTGGTDNNVVYLWRDAGTDMHKIGITSDKWGEKRITMCKQHNNMDPRIVFMLKVDDARAVEAELLKLGTDPELDSSIDGYTEFRVLTNEELGKAVSTAYQYAVAA